jgi:hypothetical protein
MFKNACQRAVLPVKNENAPESFVPSKKREIILEFSQCKSFFGGILPVLVKLFLWDHYCIITVFFLC